MKKALLIIGIILVAAGVLCLGVSWFFHWAHGSVLDGSASLYERLNRRQTIFLYAGLGLSVIGIIMLVIRKAIKA